jgi:hypothetical protein
MFVVKHLPKSYWMAMLMLHCPRGGPEQPPCRVSVIRRSDLAHLYRPGSRLIKPRSRCLSLLGQAVDRHSGAIVDTSVIRWPSCVRHATVCL